MRKSIACTLLCWLLAPLPAAACGKERWPVKTLADLLGEPTAAKPPVSARIVDLVTIGAPKRKQLTQATNRRFPQEQVVYRVSALLLGDKEEADQDFHVVAADPTRPSVTIIAEFPAGSCAAEARAKFFDELRSQFEAKFGKPTPGKLRKLAPPVSACITGVGFFDFLHGQDGVAPNGFELHPVLAIEKGYCATPPSGGGLPNEAH